MPRKHVNLKIGANKFQLSVLDPFFHRSYCQAWTPSERSPVLVAGETWRDTDLPLDLTRAMDQAVLACSTLSKRLALGSYSQIKSIIAHISRNDVTFMLELNDGSTQNEILLQFTWDQNAQLVAPTNFQDLEKLGLSPSCIQSLEADLTQSSFGRLGLVARCLRLMSTKSYTPRIQTPVTDSTPQTA